MLGDSRKYALSLAVLQIILTFAMSLGNDFLISVIIIGN